MSTTPPLDAAALLHAAFHALRSYEFGNGSPELAKECADAIEKYFAEGRPETWNERAKRVTTEILSQSRLRMTNKK